CVARVFFFSSRRRHTRFSRDWSSDVCSSDLGLVRGAEVRDTGAPISVPVGDGIKGHVFNTLGEPQDIPKSELQVTEYWPIHRPRSEERRVGKECKDRWQAERVEKKERSSAER